MIVPIYRDAGGRSTSRRGFALIISLVLMGFIMLLLLSLSALTRVETEVAGSEQLREQARMNALLGLNVAIGQLQENAAADRRVTATASIERNDAGVAMVPARGSRHWTGAWAHGGARHSMTSTPVFLNWLVSGNESRKVSMRADGSVAPFPDAPSFKPDGSSVPTLTGSNLATDVLGTDSQSWRLLVGGNSASDVEDYVVAPFVPIRNDSNTTIGGYAYWVGDEGVKAALHVVESDEVLYPESDVAEEKARLRHRRPGRTGGEALSGTWIEAFAATADLDNPDGTALRSQLERLVQAEQTGNLTGLPASFAKDHFHDMTVLSYGLLSNTLDGGLRKDLTAGFAAGTNATSRPTGILWEPMKTEVAANLGTFWQTLRTWYQYADNNDSSLPVRRNTGAGLHPLTPVAVGWQWFVQGTVSAENENDDGSKPFRLGYRMYPALILWNPYNVTIKNTTITGAYGNGRIDMTRRVTFAMRVWKDETSDANNAFPAAFEKQAQFIAPWSEIDSTAQNATEIHGEPFRFTIAIGDMEPGMAYVYTLQKDVAYTDASLSASQIYRLHRGWNFDGGNNTAIVAKSPEVFTLPAGEEVDQYQIGFWVSGGSTGGNIKNYEWNKAISGVGNNENFAIIGDDAFELDIWNQPDKQWLQSIYGINGSWRTTYIDTWSGANAPLLSDALAAGSGGDVGYYGQRWELKVTEAADIYKTSASSSGTSEYANPVRWLANYNPRANFSHRTPFENQSSATNGYFNTNASYNLFNTMVDRSGTGAPDVTTFAINHDPSTGAAYTGITQNPYSTEPQPVILFEIPRPDTRPISMGALQHVNAHRPSSNDITATVWASNTAPAYVIGNSLANPRVPLDQYRIGSSQISSKGGAGFASTRYLLDHSYIHNRALWDGYYFSSVPRGTIEFPLDNVRYERYGSATDADLRDYDRAAASLMVKGAFNVNSASPAAWRALLASFNSVPVNGEAMNGLSVYSRFSNPAKGYVKTHGQDAPAGDASQRVDAYTGGFRALTPQQIDALADEIVRQVRLRGPFLSLADFVNRSLSGTDEEKLQGALGTAIDNTSINDVFDTVEVSLKNSASMDGGSGMVKAAYDGLSAANVPGWLTQADMLQALAPVLSARSDTFVIRVVGEANRPGNADGVRAWCEAVVQRMPEYRNGDDAWAEPTQANQSIGRRFQIVSLRWLSADEI